MVYQIHGEGDNRVLELQASSSHRFRFWHRDGKEQIKFKQSGGKLIAAVTGKLLVYKLPNAHEFHREYMAHNRTALWLGLQADTDRLVDNMLEFVEEL